VSVQLNKARQQIKQVLGYFEKIDLEAPAEKRLKMALGESKRLRALLEEILLYAIPGAGRLENVDLGNLAEKTLVSLRTSAPLCTPDLQ
jgi:hypothetical protein